MTRYFAIPLAWSLFDFAMKRMFAHEFIVFHELDTSWRVFLVFVGAVAAHARYATSLLLRAFNRNDLPRAFGFLCHDNLRYAP